MDATNLTNPGGDAEAVLASALENLHANADAGPVLAGLRAIETSFEDNPPRKAKLLIARATALNRLGFPGEALADLQDAVQLLERIGDRIALMDAWRDVALVYTWRGDTGQAALALLHVIAQGGAEPACIALALIQGGRVLLEIGRPDDAQALIKRAIEIGGTHLANSERQRAGINLVQALVACGRAGEAAERLDMLDLTGATARLRRLALIERARIALASGNIAGAKAALDDVKRLLAGAAESSFDLIELHHGQAEVALAEHDDDAAITLLSAVIARCADDDLAGREIEARLIAARALERLGRAEECDRMLAAGLRRASARGLAGHADRLRGELARRGRPESMWLPGLAPEPASSRSAAQRFVRRRALGAGGFGSVNRAYDLDLGIEVALKRVSLRAVFDPATRAARSEAARAEVAAASRIAHPGVGKVYGLLDEADGDLLVIREFVEGQTLRDAMATPMPRPQQQMILGRIAMSLAAVHDAGLMHRDVKPENIVLRRDGEPVLIDFGIARDLGSVDRSPSGTPRYAAPEQIRGGRVDARADLYALGVVAYELLIGRPPVEAATGLAARLGFDARRRVIATDARAAGLSAPLADLIAALLAVPPWRRPRSARAVALDIAPS
jgi:hypothetical protein